MLSPSIRTLYQRLLSVVVCGAVALSAMPVGAAPSRGKKGKGKATAPATDGKTVALFRFSGDPKGAELRGDIQTGFEGNGFKVKSVALDAEAAAKKLKCKDEPTSDGCLETLGEWLNKSPKTAADFIVLGSVGTGPTKKAEIILYDIAGKKRVKTFNPAVGGADLIIGIALPRAAATSLKNHVEPPPAITAEEEQILAQLDEPEKTAEELAAEEKAIKDAQDKIDEEGIGGAVDIADVEVDLRKDFKAFCRTGKRKKRKSRDDPKDLRPKCQRGPVWGYWQPRAWVALTLTAGTAVGTIAFYSLALAARGPYKDATDAVDAYNAGVGGDPSRDPNLITNDGQSYDELATEVSRTGAIMRQRAIVGDVLLGTTVLLGGVLAIIIYQDRRDAKEYIRQEKALRAVAGIEDFSVGPIITKDTKGVGMRFRF